MVFSDKSYSKIQAQYSDSTSTITIDGVTSDDITPENAQTQINKILNIVGKSIVLTKMKQVITKEAVNE